MKFLLTNNILNDDFWYSLNKDKYVVCDTEEEVYLALVNYMTSLQESRSERKSWVQTEVRKYASKWLKENNIKVWFLPEASLGNQQISFGLEVVKFKISDKQTIIEVVEEI